MLQVGAVKKEIAELDAKMQEAERLLKVMATDLIHAPALAAQSLAVCTQHLIQRATVSTQQLKEDALMMLCKSAA